jgi:S-adenosylmethionine decarboxylase
MTTTRGTHLLVELYGCDPCVLSSVAAAEAILVTAATAAGATVLSSHFHEFPGGGGVTGVVVCGESHVSLHGWPEVGYAAVDVFLCGSRVAAVEAIPVVSAGLGSSSGRVLKVERGQDDPPGYLPWVPLDSTGW